MDSVIGVIGLGNMGSVIAKRLSNYYKVLGFDVDQTKIEEIKKEGINCPLSLDALASEINHLIVSLPGGQISKTVISEIAKYLSPKVIIIETSTLLPSDMKEIGNICNYYNLRVIDAAILGGIVHVTEGNANFLVGGLLETINKTREILSVLGKNIEYMGDLGAGMSAKIINNAVAHSVMVTIVEAATIGVKLGISSEKIYDLLKGETALIRPLKHRFNERVRNSDFQGGMSTINARKDSSLVLQLASELEIPLFSMQSTHTVYDIALKEGYGELDYSSIAKLWSKWTSIEY
ncbi:3-hydroxyisobutyrate dehydrogenase-like beta-hydroxyacid dehydrogenase [Salirhabdus euzebyi]|uniref:3-hydroxyisobutyrate dehydrogenase-like beta-hydroxyacid dehydrogenase n=1 Tax=Salirhabdus euzebyi TaxID=394506 RepID=A0A841Q5P0_9BACI|nr:NAD(P)-dependent oxidoreductase [Salirhabdus euzebyi]MBB6453705.1 3-hydroxyisobutyrate dehydrogenase-like beta-hydroxyacid dehydrogenase [Salirhabdus euzebyi]